VAATNASNHRSDFSNWGDYVDLGAPGESMFSCIARNYTYDEISELITHCFPAFGGAYLRRIYTILDHAIGQGGKLPLKVRALMCVDIRAQVYQDLAEFPELHIVPL
jgi:hypothetical protein